MKKYYVYIHYKKGTNIPFYVGKGCGKRAYIKAHRSVWWKKTVVKYGYDVVLLEENLSESEAIKMEIEYIAKYGRRDLGTGTLVNMTDGGDGISGYKWTEEQRKKRLDFLIGHKHSEETKRKIGDAHKGKTQSNKIVLDTISGVYYESAKEAAELLNVNTGTLRGWLNGSYPNKTNLKYV